MAYKVINGDTLILVRKLKPWRVNKTELRDSFEDWSKGSREATRRSRKSK